jgi:hypothetical protein
MALLPAALRVRAALGLQPITAPVMIYIPLGFLLGPRGVGIVSETTLFHLDMIVSVTLATLGVLIGVAWGTEGRASARLAIASSVEGAITIAVVAGAVMLLVGRWQLPLEISAGLAAMLLGVCASASAAPDDAPRVAARVADLDDVLPIVVGTAVLAVAAPSGEPLVRSLAITAAIGLGAGVTGWLLFDTASGPERNVFVLGSLALVGGGAAYFGTSPLLAGLLAGWFWAVAPGHADRIVQEDLRKVEHPLVLLVLLIAGAASAPSLVAVWLFAAFVMFRLVGKLAGGWVASRIAAGTAPPDLGAHLISPGVIGVAFALNVEQLAPGSGGTFACTVAAGAVASELIAVVVSPSGTPSAARP